MQKKRTAETEEEHAKHAAKAKLMERLEKFIDDEVAIRKEMVTADVPDRIYTYTLMDVQTGEYLSFRFGTPHFFSQMEQQVMMVNVHEAYRHYSNYPANLLQLFRQEAVDEAVFKRVLGRAREYIDPNRMYRVYGVYFKTHHEAQGLASVAFKDKKTNFPIVRVDPAEFDVAAGDMVFAPVHSAECVDRMLEKAQAQTRHKKHKH